MISKNIQVNNFFQGKRNIKHKTIQVKFKYLQTVWRNNILVEVTTLLKGISWQHFLQESRGNIPYRNLMATYLTGISWQHILQESRGNISFMNLVATFLTGISKQQILKEFRARILSSDIHINKWRHRWTMDRPS